MERRGSAFLTSKPNASDGKSDLRLPAHPSKVYRRARLLKRPSMRRFAKRVRSRCAMRHRTSHVEVVVNIPILILVIIALFCGICMMLVAVCLSIAVRVGCACIVGACSCDGQMRCERRFDGCSNRVFKGRLVCRLLIGRVTAIGIGCRGVVVLVGHRGRC